MLRHSSVVFLTLFLAASSVGAASAAPYWLTDLGTLGGTTSAAYGVNNSGWVTGWADQAGSTVPRAFLATRSGSGPYGAYSMIDVSALAGFASTVTVRGYSINNSGAMVGFADGPPNRNGFVYNGGPTGGPSNVTFLSTLPGALNGTVPWVFGINNSGQMAGAIGNVAFFYNGTTSVSLGVLGGGISNAYALNDNGLVVGNSTVSGIDPTNHLFVSSNGGAAQPLLAVDNPSGIAFAVNNAGTIVGALGGVGSGPNVVARSGADSTAVGSYRALGQAFVATSTGSSYSQAVLPSFGDGTTDGAFGISTAGAVVGESNHLAFIATQGGSAWTTTNLNATSVVPNLGTWTLQSASAISQNGNYIVGYGTLSSGGPTRAFLLAAVMPGDANLDGKVDTADLSKVLTSYDKSGLAWGDGDFDGNGAVDTADLSKVLTNYDKSLGASAGVKAVPEPSSVVLLGVGAIGLFACAWRKRK